jgi:hypothetical protein
MEKQKLQLGLQGPGKVNVFWDNMATTKLTASKNGLFLSYHQGFAQATDLTQKVIPGQVLFWPEAQL